MIAELLVTETSTRRPNEADWRRWLARANLAPSPDNNQPWRFAVAGGEVWATLELDRALPSDVNHMFDLMGLGAAIENLSLAAHDDGFDLSVEPVDGGHEPVALPTPRGGTAVARIRAVSGAEPDPLAEHIEARCTSRRFYSRRPVPRDAQEAIERAAVSDGLAHLAWIDTRRGIRRAASLVAATDAIRFQYEPFHNEIFRQLRFTARDVEETRDGLDVRTLELPPGAALALRTLRPWPRMRWVHRLRLTGALALPSWISVICSGAIGVLSIERPSLEAFLAAGRAMQRAWLAATGQQLSLHPLGSPAIFFAHLEQLGGERLSPRHARHLTSLRERLVALVPSLAGRSVAMLFRVGYAPLPRYRSLRRPVDELIDE